MNHSELSHMAGAVDDSTINIVEVIIIIIIIITKLQVAPVELVVSSEPSCAVRLARHSQNAWARHVEHVESSRDEPSGIWA